MRIRQGMRYSNTVAEFRQYKDARRGGSEDELWVDTDELIDYRKGGAKKKHTPRKGCPENNGGAHVYVNIDRKVEYGYATLHYRDKVCCGCEKRYTSKFLGSTRKKLTE